MPGDGTEEELDELLTEAEKADLPLKNKVLAQLEDYLGEIPHIPHAKKIGIVAGSILFLLLVYLTYIFVAPSFMAGSVRDAPLQNPETTQEQSAAENADRFLDRVRGLQQRAETNETVRNRIKQLGNFEFLLIVTSQRNGNQVKVWTAAITVENGRITQIQRNATRSDVECIGWMSARQAADMQLTGPQLAQQIVRGNVKIAPRHCSTDIARKAANIVLNR